MLLSTIDSLIFLFYVRIMNGRTAAAMSDHRFKLPLDPEGDTYSDIPVEEGTIDPEGIVSSVRVDSMKRASEAMKRYEVPGTDRSIESERIRAHAERILGLLLMSRYRRGPTKHVLDQKELFLQKIVRAIEQDKPVEFILSFFGSKVRNPLKTWAESGTEVDSSEMASLLRFYEISAAIKQLYSPGAIVHVACDGRKYADAIGFSEESGRGYYENIRKMAEKLGIGDAVHLFDEADHYPEGHAMNVRRHQERVYIAFRDQEEDAVRSVMGLQTSMCLSIPVDDGVEHVVLQRAYSRMTDAELEKVSKAALEYRRHIVNESVMRAIRYIAAYDAVKEAGVLEEVAPNALRATVHPKPGQLCLYAVNQHSNDVFPHHGQGTLKQAPTEAGMVDVNNIRVLFRADIQRADSDMVAITLNPKEFPFADDDHPFIIAPQND